MATCVVGSMLLFAILVGGIYLYHRVDQLDRQIASQREAVLSEADELD